MTPYLLGVDVDGCLTKGWLHIGAVAFDEAWEHAPGPLRRFIYRRQRPREWMVEVVKHTIGIGGEVCIISQRRDCDAAVTAEELARFGLPPLPLYLMDGSLSMIAHKARYAAWCRFYIDDQQENIGGIRHRLGPGAPVMWNSTRDADAIRAWAGMR